MKHKSLVIALIIIPMILLVIPNIVSAWYYYTFQSWDLVDSGKHLDWGGSSSYMTAWNFAVSSWNNADSNISGIIRKDTLSTIEDVTISDVNNGDNGVVGETWSNGKLKFNTYYMSTYCDAKRKNCAMHELGHALRLDHRTDSGTIMYESVRSITSLNTKDKEHLTYAYSNYY